MIFCDVRDAGFYSTSGRWPPPSGAAPPGKAPEPASRNAEVTNQVKSGTRLWTKDAQELMWYLHEHRR